ncbi:MAG: hypothetical protein E7632_03150 [Ruminococcaceae bacterium]|nr:hypothetical protein [Oscillospiraceae bacterium]
MKHDTNTIRKLFDAASPDAEQIARMEREILHHAQPKPSRRLRFMPIAAAALLMAIGITAVSAAPAIIRHFFPGVGIVAVQEGDAPLYMMLSDDSDTARLDCLYGYWQDGTAEVYFKSNIRYEEKELDTDCELQHIGATSTPSGMIQTYRLSVDATAKEAAEGIEFDGGLLKFDRMPAEYHPYTVEDTGLRLTMIPLTEDLTTFAMSAEYLDGRGEVELCSGTAYEGIAKPTMHLIDENGVTYPMVRYQNSEIFTVKQTPAAPIVGFRSDALTFRRAFYTDDLGTPVTVNIPYDGEAETVNLGFTFPDGVTVGKVIAVGRNNAVITDKDYSADYPMGSLTIITEASEQDGIRYWYDLNYSEDYQAYLDDYLVVETRSPYDTSPLNPMSPRMHLGRTNTNDGVRKTQHYVSDGSGTVELVADHYYGEAPGEWSIDFTK